MRIDDENKVVWCSEPEMEWYASFNLSNGNFMVCDFKRIAHLSTEKEVVMKFNADLNTRMELISAITEGYEFKVEQKYYWRKKKEYLISWEVCIFLNVTFARTLILANKDNAMELTEQEARDLLKDDFDKFEKLECD